MNPWAEKTLEVAHSQLGVREVGDSNTGVMVDQYLADVGLDPGNPWCDAFACWDGDQAAKDLQVKDPMLRSGACEVTRVFAREHGILFESPQRGDQFLKIAYINGAPHAHHTGWVTAVDDDGVTFHTIEGNTNTNGSREGYEVAALTRVAGSQYRFVRWALRCDAAPEVYGLYDQAGQLITHCQVAGGHALVPVRAWGGWLGFVVEWVDGHPQFDGQDVPGQISVIDGVAWAPLRSLAEAVGLVLTVKDDSRAIVVTRN